MITNNIARIFGISSAEVQSVRGVNFISQIMRPRYRGISKLRLGLGEIAAITLAIGLAEHATAAPITWIGGNANWDASNANWTPADEPDSNDEAIFNTPNDVNMANASDTIVALTLSGGIDLDTNGNDLNVDGLVQLTGASTNLFVGPSGSVLSADNYMINSGGTLCLTGGTVTMAAAVGVGSFVVNTGATLSGNGVIPLGDGAVPAGTILLTLSGGTLAATSTTAGDLFGTSAATLTINISDANARIDLDNSSADINVSRNDTLEINGEAHGTADSYSGTLNLSEGSTFDMSLPWQTDTGIINVNSTGIVVGTAGSAATLAGAAFTLGGGSLSLDNIVSLRLSAPFTTTAGIIANAGLIIFNANSTIGAGTDFQMTGSNASLTVAAPSSTPTASKAEPSPVPVPFKPSLTTRSSDTDGILYVTTAWNTNVANTVMLAGGELCGATVTTGTGGINGNGLVSARVINSSYIQAENGGTLILQTAANDNDWDGAGGGDLEAISGNLELRDTVSFGFTGDVFVNTGREVFTDGFELDFNLGSTLSLRNGTYRCTSSTDFGGAMSVILAGQSFLQITGTANFENGSTTTLNDNLRLNNTLTTVQVGADFTGSGALINPATRTLRLVDGVVSTDFNVLVQNEGLLQLGTVGNDAQVQATDYQQTATGALQIELGGVALNAFDRLNLTGAAALTGGLNLSLIGGFIPAVGQTFNILTASSGISGTFNVFSQPAGMPAGLGFKLNYSAFIVQLEVVTLSPFEIWINTFAGITNPADRLKGANPDNDELINQAEFALDGNPASGAASGKVVMKIAPVAGSNALTLTLPVRTGAILDPADPAGGELGLIKVADAVSYRVQASDQLTNWTLTVAEVTGADATAIQLGQPALNVGWGYRSFRSPGPVVGDPVEFMRIFIGE